MDIEGEKEFYNSIKEKLLYSKIDKKGVLRKMFFIEYKKNYKLTLEHKEALIGILLGDAYLSRLSFKGNTALHLEQSYPAKKNYLMHLFELYKPLITNYPKIIIRKPDKRTGKIYESIAVRTSKFSCFNEYHNLFYKDKIKIVAKNIAKLLTPRGLAYWIMDDGSLSKYNQTILHTRAFEKDHVILLQNALKKIFNLNSRIEEKEKNQWVIFIPVKQKVPLKTIVMPYMVDSMLYKINLNDKQL